MDKNQIERFDTIIVGAGLAGCILGYLLLNQKKSVIIIEKQNLKKKNKLCGGIITSKAYKLLLKIYGDNINNLDFKKFEYTKVKNNGLIKIIKIPTIYTIYRKYLDNFVVDMFKKNGGKILENINYDKIDFKNKILYIAGKSFKYNKLVGADGIFSNVRNDLLGKKQKMNFAIEKESSKKEDIIQIDFLDCFKGYAWNIPNNETNLIGLGDVSQDKDILNKFVNYFQLENSDKIKGAFLPTGNDIFLKKDDVYFVGDAAGLACPVTGEGIYYAISSAYNLSKSINYFYKIKMLKDRLMIFKHRIYKPFIYNTFIRNFGFKFYEKSRIVSFFINSALKSLL